MADRGSNGNKFNASSFNDFCQGYLLGLEDNHVNHQQNADLDISNMDLDQAFADPNPFSMDSPEDFLDGALFCADPEQALGGGLLFEQHVNTQLPLTLVNPFYSHPADAQGGVQGFELYEAADAHGSGNLANGYAPMSADPSFSYYVAHPDPLVPAQSRFLPTTANGFVGMRVENLIFERPEPLNESCDLALSDAGDENTNHEQNEGASAPNQRCQLAHLPTQPQPPPPSPEEHAIPCGRENCHICQVFSLPF